ncbi:unnamed protein product [Rhizophagus irregularis]|nr:unnamed protein product [Rhizophagus irregularis]
MEPDKLGGRKIRPLLDPNKFKLLNNIKDNFLMKFEKAIPFSCVVEGLVDGKEVIVAFVDQSEGEPTSPVFDDNGKLWGICIVGIPGQISYVVPIHLILGDVKNKFNSAVFTLKEDVKESWAD